MQKRHERLAGLRILVAEDEALVVMHIEDVLEQLGCEIVGPVSTVEAAVAAIEREDGRLDGALLDVNLRGRTIAPAAEALSRRAVPFLLVTGYAAGQDGDPPVLRDAPRLSKPFGVQDLDGAMARAFAFRPEPG